MSEQETNKQERELSPEEMAEQRQRMIFFYKGQEEYLSAILKHEELKANISKARAERIMYDIRIAQMMAGPQEEEFDEETPTPGADHDIDKKKRTLKKSK
jgi:acyl-CoA reductase-like NAD-dependent aldehyde dehydrogenase